MRESSQQRNESMKHHNGKLKYNMFVRALDMISTKIYPMLDPMTALEKVMSRISELQSEVPSSGQTYEQ